jgi:hypothetical protein
MDDMVANRLLDIFSLMERHDLAPTAHAALCAVAEEFLVLDGAGIVLSDDHGGMTSLCASNDTAHALMNLELVLGEGPTIDACRGDTVNVPDLLDAREVPWAIYAPEAIVLGARAVLSCSIRLGAVRLGALSLFRFSAGPFNEEQEKDAFLMASVAGRAILAYESGASRGLVGDLEGGSLLDFSLHQAAGMVAVQGSMTVRDALISLRAHSFVMNCDLSVLAGRVLSRRARFDPLSQSWLDDPDGVSVER